MRVEKWFIIFVAISACWVAIFASSIKIFLKRSYGVIHGKQNAAFWSAFDMTYVFR